MKILLGAPAMTMGGTELAAVNLATGLSEMRDAQGRPLHDVTLLALTDRGADRMVTDRLGLRVNLEMMPQRSRYLTSPAYRSATLLGLHGSKFSPYSYVMSGPVVDFMKRKRFDVINTHLKETDDVFAMALRQLEQVDPLKYGDDVRPPLVGMDHGAYKALEGHYAARGQSGMYNRSLRHTLNGKLDYMITITPQQEAFWDEKNSLFGASLPHRMIFNGFRRPPGAEVTREELGYKKDDFVFAMAARGNNIHKGFLEAINGFNGLDDPKAKLLLIGAGFHIDNLRELHGNNENIKFLGQVPNVYHHFQAADVALHLSTMRGESLPTVLTEAICAGKPVIASDIGASALQITNPRNGEVAGFVQPIVDEKIDINEVTQKMRRLQFDEAYREKCSENARGAAEQFDPAVTLAQTVAVFREAIQGRQAANAIVAAPFAANPNQAESRGLMSVARRFLRAG